MFNKVAQNKKLEGEPDQPNLSVPRRKIQFNKLPAVAQENVFFKFLETSGSISTRGLFSCQTFLEPNKLVHSGKFLVGNSL